MLKIFVNFDFCIEIYIFIIPWKIGEYNRWALCWDQYSWVSAIPCRLLHLAVVASWGNSQNDTLFTQNDNRIIVSEDSCHFANLPILQQPQLFPQLDVSHVISEVKQTSTDVDHLGKDSYRDGRNTPHWFSKIWNQQRYQKIILTSFEHL